MEDKDLERKLDAARKAIEGAELSPEHKESLQEALDQAAKSANGSSEKLHDLTVAVCKGAIRSARSDISFRDRVIDAVQGPLDKLREDLIKAVGDLLTTHTVNCPNKFVKSEPPPPTTLLDVAKIAVQNKWFYIAISVIAFSPNLVAVVELWKK
jgi:hypothetical protein